jgi:hypothetical protein
MTTKTFLVTADHSLAKYGCRDAQATCRQDRFDGLWCAVMAGYGCSKSYRTAQEAIHAMLQSHGCYNIRLVEVPGDDARTIATCTVKNAKGHAEAIGGLLTPTEEDEHIGYLAAGVGCARTLSVTLFFPAPEALHPALTFSRAKSYLDQVGISIRRTGHGEYRVAYPGRASDNYDPEESASYADHLDDAVGTGYELARWRDRQAA